MGYSSMTRDVLSVRTNGRDQGRITERIALFVYEYPVRKWHWDHDERSEFFCQFFPRLPALIARFAYTGRPFEAYLCSCLKWQMRTFVAQRVQKERKYRLIRNQIYWLDQPAYVHDEDATEIWESEPDYGGVFRVSDEGRMADEVSKKRLLFLAMRSANFADERIIRKVADLTGYNSDWLACCAGALRASIDNRRTRLQAYYVRRNHCFFRIQVLQDRLAEEVELPLKKEVTRELLREQTRLESITRSMTLVPLVPSHREIAAVLEVPKGTVDSALNCIRRAFDSPIGGTPKALRSSTSPHSDP